MVLFDFSLNETKDLRDEKDKGELLFVTLDNLEQVLATQYCETWDMNYIEKFVEVCKKQGQDARNKHLKYVKSIHR